MFGNLLTYLYLHVTGAMVVVVVSSVVDCVVVAGAVLGPGVPGVPVVPPTMGAPVVPPVTIGAITVVFAMVGGFVMT